MDNGKVVEILKRNIFHLDWSMDDAPYHGFNGDNIAGVRFAINKILEGTELTTEGIHREMLDKEAK